MYMEVLRLVELLVLGALNLKPMSGYDIQLLLQENEAEKWSGVQVGSIYHALKKLEKGKFIEIERIAHVGHRQKATFRITSIGKDHLKTLIADTIKTAAVPYPLSIYAALSFIELLPKEEIEDALITQLAKLEEELHSIQKGMDIKSKHFQEGLPPMIHLVSENMFKILKLQIQFMKDLLVLIK